MTIAEMLQKGYTYEQIARTLHVSNRAISSVAQTTGLTGRRVRRVRSDGSVNSGAPSVPPMAASPRPGTRALTPADLARLNRIAAGEGIRLAKLIRIIQKCNP